MPLRHGWNDPLDRLRKIENEMNRRSGTRASLGMSEYPVINVWTGEHDVVVTAEMPGVDPDDVELTVHRNALTVKGRRRPEADAEAATYHRRERSYGKFGRTISLPFDADSSKVQADCDAGILRIYIPRPESEKPRRIAIARA